MTYWTFSATARNRYNHRILTEGRKSLKSDLEGAQVWRPISTVERKNSCWQERSKMELSSNIIYQRFQILNAMWVSAVGLTGVGDKCPPEWSGAPLLLGAEAGAWKNSLIAWFSVHFLISYVHVHACSYSVAVLKWWPYKVLGSSFSRGGLPAIFKFPEGSTLVGQNKKIAGRGHDPRLPMAAYAYIMT